MSFNSFASAATDPGTLAALLAAGACFATVMTIAQPMLQSRGFDNRLKSVASKREELKRKNRAALAGKDTKSVRLEAKGFMKDVVDKFNLSTLLEDEKLNDKLTQAGLRGPGPTATFYFARMATPIILGVLAFLYVALLKP